MKKGFDWKLWLAVAIEGAMVLVSMPRWTPALMLADGYPIPASWESWWTPMSAAFNSAMALVEAAAIAYVAHALSRSSGREALRLMVILVLMIITFMVVLAPFVSASVARTTLDEILQNPGSHVMAIVWGSAVVLSTGVTVIAVAQAQAAHEGEVAISRFLCWCTFRTDDEDDWLDHQDLHKQEALSYPSNETALTGLLARYGQKREQVLPPAPRLVDISRLRGGSGLAKDNINEQQLHGT